MSEQDLRRYTDAAHAMQTAVAIDHARGNPDGSPKHLRVGVNAAMVDHAALATLLMDKGLITLDEYEAALAAAMEREVARYRDHLGIPDGVALG
jgi:hypothetical protein